MAHTRVPWLGHQFQGQKVKGQLVADVLNSQHAGIGATWRINTKILSTCRHIVAAGRLQLVLLHVYCWVRGWKMLKICQVVAKLWARVRCPVFYLRGRCIRTLSQKIWHPFNFNNIGIDEVWKYECEQERSCVDEAAANQWLTSRLRQSLYLVALFTNLWTRSSSVSSVSWSSRLHHSRATRGW